MGHHCSAGPVLAMGVPLVAGAGGGDGAAAAAAAAAAGGGW